MSIDFGTIFFRFIGLNTLFSVGSLSLSLVFFYRSALNILVMLFFFDSSTLILSVLFNFLIPNQPAFSSIIQSVKELFISKSDQLLSHSSFILFLIVKSLILAGEGDTRSVALEVQHTEGRGTWCCCWLLLVGLLWMLSHRGLLELHSISLRRPLFLHLNLAITLFDNSSHDLVLVIVIPRINLLTQAGRECWKIPQPGIFVNSPQWRQSQTFPGRCVCPLIGRIVC